MGVGRMMADTMVVTGLILAFIAGFLTALALIATSLAWYKYKSDKK